MKERNVVENEPKFACGDGKNCCRKHNCSRCPIESERRIDSIMLELSADSQPYLGDNVSPFD